MSVSITGLGALTPAGDFTLHSFSAREDDEFSIHDFNLANYPVSPKTYLDRASALALGAAGLALQDAGLSGPFDEEFGLCVGTQFGAVETMRTFEAALAEKGPRGTSPLLFSHSYFNSPAAIIAIEWGLKGYHSPLVGINSGWQAVELARDAIELGHATRMLCGAVDAHSTAREWAGESAIGEAAVFLVLEAGENGKSWEEVFGEPHELQRNFGAVSGILSRLKLVAHA